MNRIILIGNGFDRAHGLETSYKDFIDDFWKREAEKIKEYKLVPYHGSKKVYEDLYISLTLIEDDYVNWLFLKGSVDSFSDFESIIDKYNEGRVNTRARFIVNKFLEYISRVSSLQNWVDIEDAYHKFLNAIHRKGEVVYDGKNYGYTDVKDLHKDFENVRKALEEYLTRVMERGIEAIDGMREIIYSEFDGQDFTSKGLDTIAKAEYRKIATALDPLEFCPYKVAERYRTCFEQFDEEKILHFIKYNLMNSSFSKDHDLSIEQLLLLNFNYTNLEKLYVDYYRGDEIIHIHGELNNPNNPMIFGYGDELGEEYKELEKLNNNEYLENIKSIKYLETSNYKKMLSFVDSEEYQIFIFGHSCGNSDRTLLNRLFEHENCVSIKVFYHGTKEKNNYSDVIRNISRNFNDKTSFREKVVNKEYSEALPQVSKAK